MTRSGGGREDEAEIEFLVPRADVFDRSGAFDGVIDATPPRRRSAGSGRRGDGDALGTRGDTARVRIQVDPVERAPGDEQEVGGERARPRSATTVAGLGVSAVVALAVVAGVSWSSDDGAAPAPATTIVTVTPPSSATTADAPSPSTSDAEPLGRPTLPNVDVDLSPRGPGWVVAEPPAGMDLVGAFDQGRFATPEGWLDIWATPTADRLTGTWLSVALARTGAGVVELVPGGEAVDVGGTDGLVTTARDGVAILTWRPDPRHRLTVMAFGVTREQLLAIAGGMAVERGEVAYATTPSAALGLSLDQLVHVRRGASELAAEAVELGERVVVYAEPSGGLGSLVVGVRRAQRVDTTIARFLLASTVTAAGDPVERHIDVGGAAAVVGTAPFQPELQVVQWRRGDDWITALSTASIDDVIPSLRTARDADEQEWDALIERGLDQSGGRGDEPVFVQVGNGVTAEARWTASISDDARYLFVRSDRFYHQEFTRVDPTRPFRAYRSTDATFVVALLDAAAVGGATTLQITPEASSGAPPASAPLVRLRDGAAFAAVVAFAGTGAYETALV